jgi:uncharacterized membrane protein YcaP (DUF421 family)
MEQLFNIDWTNTFVLQQPIIETILRGTIVYLSLFILLRFIMKREAAVVGITDLLVVVLLADAAQNAMADDYRSIPDGMVLILTILFWAHALNWLGYRFPSIQRIVHPPPLQLVKDGQLQRRNMRQELITQDELMGLLRQQGIEDVSEVKRAYMEGDGRISVVAYNGQQRANNEEVNPYHG